MRREAKRQADLSIQSGFRHHDRFIAQEQMLSFLKNGELPLHSASLSLDTYAQVLAPTPLRAMKNGTICLITVISRMAIQYGVSPEKSFSLSDYFVYMVEEMKNKKELEHLIDDMFSSYSDLLHADPTASYSRNVTKAIRYIEDHLYDHCSVDALAAYLSLNPRYFSTLFKKETGVSPSAYIKQRKMSEAYRLITQSEYPVSEVAEMLAFGSTAYFSSEFKRVYSVSPHSCKTI